VFDHVTIRVADREASERFYRPLLAILGHDDWGPFALEQSDAPTRGLHIGFAAPSREHIERFWQAGVDAGHRDDGAPGPRPEYGPDYWGGFLLDPDGNSAEAARHDETPGRDVIDHLWIRVADVAASRRVYDRLAAHGAFDAGREIDGRVHYGRPSGSFAILAGAPTRNVRLVFDSGDVVEL
jgi:catechol 2,3-dioxygenase-like lactoylglutathione lyase family enzyme